MSSRLDMSLDDVAKERNAAHGRGAGRGGGARRSIGGGARGGAPAAPTPYEVGPLGRAQPGGIMHSRTDSRSLSPLAARTRQRPAPRSTQSAWTHDLYNTRPGAPARARSFGNGSGNTEGSTRIMVTNVHYEVTEADLKVRLRLRSHSAWG